METININGKEISFEELEAVLQMLYYGEYGGEEHIEDFIHWIGAGCPDDDDDDDDDDEEEYDEEY